MEGEDFTTSTVENGGGTYTGDDGNEYEVLDELVVTGTKSEKQSEKSYSWNEFTQDAAPYAWLTDLGTAGLESTPGSFRLGTTGQGFSPKYYGNAWRGNQYAKTYNIGKLGAATSRGLLGVGIALDGYSWYNGDISLGKLGFNTGMAVWGTTPVGAVPTAFYFGAEAFHPQGAAGLINDAEQIHTETRRILGPGWRPVPFAGK